MHRIATKHTKSLARDLRTIFGGVLVNQADESNNRATYCVVSSNKANGDDTSGNDSGSGSKSASGSSSTTRTKTATATGAAASASSSSASPWQLKESHVRWTVFALTFWLDSIKFYRVEPTFSLVGIFSLGVIQLTVSVILNVIHSCFDHC